MDATEALESGQDPVDRAFFGKSETRSDDLTSHRLLNRAELVSHHEDVKRTKKPFEKKQAQLKVKSKKTKKQDLLLADKFDMSEQQSSESNRMTMKNIIPSSSGALV